MIAAYSPQARGRSERAFGTLQDRLPKELADAAIADRAAANRFLKRRFVTAYNREFAASAAETGSAFVPWVGGNLNDILCVQEERVVRPDNCVANQNKLLQIPLIATAATTSKRRSACTNTQTVTWLSSMDRAAWRTTLSTERKSKSK